MAVKAFKEVRTKGIIPGDLFGEWELEAGDEGMPLICPRYSDKSVQIFGNFDGATVKLKVTNDKTLQNWQDAYDYEGVTISQSADRKPWVILPNVYAIKAVVEGGDVNTFVNVAVVAKGA